ncbi:MAG: DUF4105 domain-containing protein [Paramuribaculum sp.]|nr:DUF4105 domain-containing protein [Paramuribaculum sp.]
MKHLAATIILLIAFFSLTAQTVETDTLRSNKPTNWRVSLLTCGPGKEIYQLEGHSALRLRALNPDSTTIDCVANWGVFDFASPGFVYRFVKGETDYMLGISDFDRFIYPYQLEQRWVVEQDLDLTEQQAEKVAMFISENFKPENRIYRYNYIHDNCATRPLEIIEKAIGDTIALSMPQAELIENATFRGNMQVYHKGYPWYQFGIDLALGSDLDAPISTREMSFAPLALMDMVSLAKINGRPLVKETVELLHGNPEATRLPDTPWWLSPLFVSILLAVITLAISVFDVLGCRLTKWFDTILYLIFGLAGSLITFLVFFSVHEPASPNWLLLWLNPLCFIVPIFIWTKKTNRLVMCYQIANFVALICMAVIWIFSIQKPNPAFVPLLLVDAMRSITYLIVYKCQPKSRRGKNQYRVNYYAR